MKRFFLTILLLLMGGISVFSQNKEKPISVSLDGAINFRDIGGYSTSTGKRVNTNKIFRSAEISTLTDNDLSVLQNLHISSVIDFRGIEEAKKAPDRLPNTAEYYLCSAGSDNIANGNYADFIEKLKNNDDSFLMDLYGEKSIEYFGSRYKLMFEKLLNTPDNQAILYHCTGGRDRTGMATALIYYILEVPMQTIEDDYLASNILLKEKKKVGSDGSDQILTYMMKATSLSKEEIENRMALKPEYIRTFFRVINEKYGSVEQFLNQEMGITPLEIQKLRTKYTK